MMETQVNSIHARLRVAGGLIIAGLVVQAISLLWNHPLSFIAFVVIGGLFLAVGIVLYLFILVNVPAAHSEEKANSANQTSQS